MVPIADLHVQNGKDSVGASAKIAVQMDGAVLSVIAFLLVLDEAAEHGVAMAQVMAIDGNVLAGHPVDRAFQREQAAQLAFLAREQVVQIVRRIVRTDNRVINHGSGNRKPGGKIPVLRQTGIQINAGTEQRGFFR